MFRIKKSFMYTIFSLITFFSTIFIINQSIFLMGYNNEIKNVELDLKYEVDAAEQLNAHIMSLQGKDIKTLN